MSSNSALILKNWKYLNCRPDLIVISKDSEYKVHTIVVLCLSPYFQKLLHYRLQSTDGYYRLDMKDVSDQTLVSIVNFAYIGEIDINDDNIEEMVITSDKYNIISIMNRCEDYLWQRLDSENCIETYLLSHYYNCYQLKTKTEKFIIVNKVLEQLNGDNPSQKFTVEMALEEWCKQNQQ